MTDSVVPETYPFPEDRVLYCSAFSDFNPDSDSYIAIAELPDSHTVEINGREHENTHRLVLHSPIRGPESFLVNADHDFQGLLSATLVLMAENDMGGEGVASVDPSFFKERLGIEIDF